MPQKKKICLFLQRRFAYIGHAMALHMQELEPGTEFCGIVSQRSSMEFLRNQTDIHYASLVLEEDIHARLFAEPLDMDYLRRLEDDYGIPNLWPYLYADRVVMHSQLVREYPYDVPLLSETDMLRRLQVTAKAVIELLETERPDAVVTSVIGSVASMLLYHIAKKKGIRTIHIEFARIGNRIAFSEDYRTFTWVKEKFEEIARGRNSPQQEAARRFLETFRSAPMHYDEETMPEFYANSGRLAQIRFLNPKRLLRSIPFHARIFLHDLRRMRRFDYTDIPVWFALWDLLKRKVRGLRGYTDLTSRPDWKERFAYFPLHIEPEVATMLYAPFYTNQAEIIRIAARSLPVGMPLYVKEHPGMAGYRTRAFYKQLVKIPNVRLIHPRISGLDLAKASSLTIAITSTNAWESILFKKPVITFGDVYYNDIPGVKRCRGFEDLPALVKGQLEEWRHDEETLAAYVSALLEDSVEVDFSAMWNRSASVEEIRADAGMQALSRLLLEKVGAPLAA